jgi:hypothetical protein
MLEIWASAHALIDTQEFSLLRTACVPAAEVAFPKILMPVMSRSIMTLGADWNVSSFPE